MGNLKSLSLKTPRGETEAIAHSVSPQLGLVLEGLGFIHILNNSETIVFILFVTGWLLMWFILCNFQCVYTVYIDIKLESH